MADFGHSRDGKKGKKQIVFGLLCASDGCPIAVELFSGDTCDPTTLGPQVARIQDRFGIRRVALVGDRGMITTVRICHDLEPAGLNWISAVKAIDIRKFARTPANKSGDKKPPQPALAPETPIPYAVAEIRSPDFPGERLMVCLNPRLKAERSRKGEELLAATEETLERIAASVRAGALSEKAEIGRGVGREANRRKIERHFEITVDDESMTWARRQEKIAAEARFDGVYVVRTSLVEIEPEAAVSAYKSLSVVDRAFRIAKSGLRVRPVYVYTEDHVRGHAFLCLLAYHFEWHMRQRLATLLFEDEARPAAEAQRNTPVEKAQVSPSSKRKPDTKRTPDGFPVHGFETLRDDLSSVLLNILSMPEHPESKLALVTQPTPLLARAFEFLEVTPSRLVPIRMTGRKPPDDAENRIAPPGCAGQQTH